MIQLPKPGKFSTAKREKGSFKSEREDFNLFTLPASFLFLCWKIEPPIRAI